MIFEFLSFSPAAPAQIHKFHERRLCQAENDWGEEKQKKKFIKLVMASNTSSSF